jgi:hypothetical protein
MRARRPIPRIKFAESVNFTGDLGVVASSDVTAGVRHGIGFPSAGVAPRAKPESVS